MSDLKLWKVRVQLVDPNNDTAYREDVYEYRTQKTASDAAFNACDNLTENEDLITINGEVAE
jgi:hypothetical protein